MWKSVICFGASKKFVQRYNLGKLLACKPSKTESREGFSCVGCRLSQLSQFAYPECTTELKTVKSPKETVTRVIQKNNIMYFLQNSIASSKDGQIRQYFRTRDLRREGIKREISEQTFSEIVSI
ncbi:hypothetical protein V1477_010159 [Vespula maculifrons]|uniref:Uncharacterized protein n=1 Tax=Vespula maculifrons TaxID=7453 RepID=A0ABD2C7R6_VESMC